MSNFPPTGSQRDLLSDGRQPGAGSIGTVEAAKYLGERGREKARRPLRLMLVEANDEEAERLQKLCRQTGLELAELCHVRRLETAVGHLTEQTFDAVLLDPALPDSSGVATIQDLVIHATEVPIIVVTSAEDEALALHAIQVGAQDYLVKDELTPTAFRRALMIAIERQQIVLELRRKATTDGLTGLNNRQGFWSIADYQLKVAERTLNPAILLYFDLDGFKAINDRYGHPVGDLALQSVARLLQQCCRKADLVARLGGDEFVVLVINDRDSEWSRLCQRIMRGLQALGGDAATPWTLSMSFGISRFDPGAPVSLAELLHQADRAMYQAKRSVQLSGRSNIQ